MISRSTPKTASATVIRPTAVTAASAPQTSNQRQWHCQWWRPQPLGEYAGGQIQLPEYHHALLKRPLITLELASNRLPFLGDRSRYRTGTGETFW